VVEGDEAFQEGRYDDAFAKYSRAYRINPQVRLIRKRLATVMTVLGRGDEGQKYK
jgi:cytochrome c-type biogenesis protein CcmH/NrfG